MTKVKQYEVTCKNCGNKFPAAIMFSTNNFLPKPSPEEEQKNIAFWEKNGVCSKCGTKNEITADSPEMEFE